MAECAEALDTLISHSDIDRLAPIPRWRELKRLMREAARVARDRLTRAGTPPLEARLMIFRSVARAVHFDDLDLANELLSKATPARGLLRLEEGADAVVSLIDPMQFRRQYEQLQQEVLASRLARAKEEVQAESTPFLERKRLRAR
eukprot:4570349-Pyramimonas_sp.AAC.1